MADYRIKIYELDNKIQDAQDDHEKLMLLSEGIELNRNYAHSLRRPIAVKIVFGVLILPLGLLALFPQVIVRSIKANVAIKRAKQYEELRQEIRSKKAAEQI